MFFDIIMSLYLYRLSTTRGVPLEKCNIFDRIASLLLYYKNESQVLFPFLSLRLKSQLYETFCQYLIKYAFVHRRTKFWKVPRQTNAYVSNKWPLKLPCAYLNTQGSSPSDTMLVPIDDRKFFDIIMRYSLKMSSVVKCFVGFALLGDKFSPPFLTGRSARYLIGPLIRRPI
ncbi:hypothetical protein T01_13432, partial [Trichinella spiralis]